MNTISFLSTLLHLVPTPSGYSLSLFIKCRRTFIFSEVKIAICSAKTTLRDFKIFIVYSVKYIIVHELSGVWEDDDF